jgi:hypothetical protein
MSPGQGGHNGVVARGGGGDAMEVLVDVEVPVVNPERSAHVQRCGHELLAHSGDLR